MGFYMSPLANFVNVQNHTLQCFSLQNLLFIAMPRRRYAFMPSFKKCEQIRMYHVQRAIGVAFLDHTRDVDLAGT